jgi:uncharacterized protein (DUF433 family)
MCATARCDGCVDVADMSLIPHQLGRGSLPFDCHNGAMATVETADLSRITIVPGQRSGQPCIRGLRVTVWDVLDMLASGMSEDEILANYPYLEKADFPAVYAYASQTGRARVTV